VAAAAYGLANNRVYHYWFEVTNVNPKTPAPEDCTALEFWSSKFEVADVGPVPVRKPIERHLIGNWVCGAKAWTHRSDSAGEMQIINPLGRGSPANHSLSGYVRRG